jgi:PPE-repeat protein
MLAETEARYQDMWVNNSAAMYRYPAASALATAQTPVGQRSADRCG